MKIPVTMPLSNFQLLIWLSNRFEPKIKKLNIVAKRRLQGHLNIQALNFALNALLKKHECFVYRVLNFRPAQRVQNKIVPFNLIANNLESMTSNDQEMHLETSFNELMFYYPWRQNAPLLQARLFFLDNDSSELQLAMPHIIADDVCVDILFSELSKFYLLYDQESSLDKVRIDKQYREYLISEDYYSHAYIERDFIFWEKYLQDTHLFTFPSEHIVKDMQSSGFSYSTYFKLPEHVVTHLQQYCAKKHVSIHDGLCAALALALFNCCDNYSTRTPSIFMNRVKSNRDQEGYDDTIGCFLRLEPIKVQINKNSTLVSLSKQVHQSVLDTNPFQQCSSLVKLACLSEFQRDRNIFTEYLIRLFVSCYTILVRSPQLNSKLLNLCARLTSLGRTNNFVININPHSNFIESHKTKKDPNLFGYSIINGELLPYDLLNIDYVFDVCFIRDDNQNTPYLVISANLNPEFREGIAKEMVRIILESSEPQVSTNLVPEASI